MKTLRISAGCFLALLAVSLLGADLFAPHDSSMQFREHANEPPTRAFPLGTDDLGRDRLSRLLRGGRVSVLCAPAAALVAIAFAGAIGVAAGLRGGWIDALAGALIDLFLSLPWLFAILTLRALLPLNASPWLAIAAIFGLLAMVGWASAARLVRASVVTMRDEGPILYARAYGCGGWRLIWFHILPNLRPVLSAQFWILVPVFLLTEANLGLLGLGIPEPMPSWGNILSELQNYQRIPESPWILAPAALLVLVIASLHFLVSGSRTWE
jgi:peptide/nickel transport system permease protein